MAAVRHFECLKVDLDTQGDPIFYLHTEYGEGILIGGVDMPPKSNSKQRPLAVKFFFWFQFWHVSSNGNLRVCDHTNLSQVTHRPVTVSNAPLTRPSSLCLSQWAKCWPRNTQNGGTLLLIANLFSDSKSGSQVHNSDNMLLLADHVNTGF